MMTNEMGCYATLMSVDMNCEREVAEHLMNLGVIVTMYK